MSRVIAISAPGGKGKTPTIKLVKDILLSKGFVEVNVISNNGEYIGVIQFSGVLIGICSVGDRDYMLKNHFGLLRAAKCQYIIGACKSYGRTKEYIESLGGHIITKTLASTNNEKREANLKDANEMIDCLKSFSGLNF